jgi:hypothetical protein
VATLDTGFGETNADWARLRHELSTTLIPGDPTKPRGTLTPVKLGKHALAEYVPEVGHQPECFILAVLTPGKNFFSLTMFGGAARPAPIPLADEIEVAEPIVSALDAQARARGLG